MPNVASVLRDEIRRLARRETKAAVAPLRKVTYALVRRLAEQRRRIAELERAARRRPPASGAEGAESEGRARFSAGWMRTHRKRLGLSRQAYAKLLGVSSQSVMAWERGGKRPRRATLEAWSRLRKTGVREIRRMLEEAVSAKRPKRRRARAKARAAGRAKRKGRGRRAA